MPDTPTSLAIRDKVETMALAWFERELAAALLATPALVPLWAPVTLRRRKNQLERSFPRVVFDAPNAPEEEAVEGLYRVSLQIYLGTSADEAPVPTGFADLAEAHQRRSGLIEEIFGFGNRPAMIAWAADPTGPIKGLLLYDLYVEDGMGDQTDRHWFDQANYSVVASLQDE